LEARRYQPAPLLALLTSRLLVWSAGVGAVGVFGTAIPGGINPPGLVSGFGRFADRLAAPAARWDAAWYLLIAQRGYEPTAGVPAPARAVFFPFYPLAVAALGWTGAPVLLAGVLLSLVALGAALLALRRLTALEFGDRAGTFAVWALALCPMAVFYSAIYTDSLFLAVSIGAVLLARSGRWAPAALLLALATATRNTGILLLAPVAILYLYGPRADRPPDFEARGLRPGYRIRWDAAWLGLAPAGLIAYLAYWGIAGNDPLAPLHGEVWFSHHFADAGPFGGLWDGARAAVRDLGRLVDGHLTLTLFGTGPSASASTGWGNLLPFALLALSLPAIAGVLRELPVAYGVYTVLGLAVPLCSPVAGEPLRGLPRYETLLFPLFMWLGLWLSRRPRLAAPVLVVSGLGAALIAAEFATWHFVA
jgi:hypothetical protein